MARMTKSEWEAFCKKTNFKDTEGTELAEKSAMEKFMKELEHIQYYPQDLAYALDIGEIADMHVDYENNVQVLRMTVVPKDKQEYKTVKVAPPQQAKKAVQRKQPKQTAPRVQRAVIDADELNAPGNKLIQMGKNWMQRKEKPQFMKDAGF